jgi:hypothetical protein
MDIVVGLILLAFSSAVVVIDKRIQREVENENERIHTERAVERELESRGRGEASRPHERSIYIEH